MLARRLETCGLGSQIKYVPYETAYTSSAVWTVPYTQWYEIHVVGTGGTGGAGNTGNYGAGYHTKAGGGGGGGGSGGHTAGRYLLAAGMQIPLTIDTATTFGDTENAFYMSVAKGGNGGDGEYSPADDFTVGAGGTAGAKGRVVNAGNLTVGNTGNAGKAGSEGQVGVSESVTSPGGAGGASPYKGYGAGGAGGDGTKSKRNAGKAGVTGAVTITAYQQE